MRFLRGWIGCCSTVATSTLNKTELSPLLCRPMKMPARSKLLSALKSKPALRILAGSIAVAAASLATVIRTHATSYYWDTVGGTWDTATDWTTDPTGSTIQGSAIPGSLDLVTFNGSAVNGVETIALGASNEAALGVIFQNTSATTLLSTTAGQTLTIGGSGLTLLASAGPVTIGDATLTTGLTLGAAQAWTNNSTSNALTVVNGITLGTNALTLSGPGGVGSATINLNGIVSGTIPTGTVGLTINKGAVVTLGNAGNTFTGDITIDGAFSTLIYSGGTTTTTSQLGLGSGTNFKQVFLTNGGIFSVTASFNDNPVSVANPAAGVIFNIGNGGTFNTAAGVIFTLDDGAGPGTVSTANELQGNGPLTKTGVGTLAMKGQTSFNGAINVTAGTLQALGSSGVLGNNANGTTFQSGAAFDLNGQSVFDIDIVTINGAGLASNPQGVITNSSPTSASYSGSNRPRQRCERRRSE